MPLDGRLTTAFQRVASEFKSIRTALAGKAPLVHTHGVGDITPGTGTKSSTTYLNGTGTWSTPTNTTYANPATSEITGGTAVTQRTISADLLKQAVRFWVTGSLTTAVTTFGSSIVTAADAAAARALLGAGTSNLALGLTSSTAKPGDWAPAVSDVSGLQGLLDSKATKATGSLGSGIPWEKEVVIDGPIADGYNKMPGGIMANAPLILTSIAFRLEDHAAVIGGTGNLTVEWWAGSATERETTLIATSLIPAGQHNVNTVLGTEVAVDVNTVLRAKFTMGSTTVAGSVYVQWRGRYQ